MSNKQRDALARGDILGWLETMAPDERADIRIMSPDGGSVTLVAARIGAVQVGISPMGDVDVHVHDNAEDAAECYANNVAQAQAQADRLNAVAAMPAGPERGAAAVRLMLDMIGDGEQTVDLSAMAPPVPVSLPPVREVSTGLYL